MSTIFQAENTDSFTLKKLTTFVIKRNSLTVQFLVLPKKKKKQKSKIHQLSFWLGKCDIEFDSTKSPSIGTADQLS